MIKQRFHNILGINSKPGFKANGLQSEVSAPKAKHSVTHSVTEENVETNKRNFLNMTGVFNKETARGSRGEQR